MMSDEQTDAFRAPDLGTDSRSDTSAEDGPKTRVLSYVAIEDIKANPYYVRKPSRSLRRKLKASYRKFGENAPVLLDRNLRVLAGTQRLLALKELGRTHVWAYVLEHLNEAEARAYAVADNRLAADASFDLDRLPPELKTISELDADFQLEDLGFDTAEIDRYFQCLDDSEFDENDEFDATTGRAVSRAGDLWHLGPHRILCGDSLQAESYTRLMRGERARVVATDPPFNLRVTGFVTGNGRRKHREFAMAAGEMSPAQFTDFLTSILQQAKQHSADGALVFSFMDFRHMREILSAGDTADLELLTLCVWKKFNGGLGGLYRNQHELCFVFKNGEAPYINNVELGKHGRNRTNVWLYPGANSFPRRGQIDPLSYHPTSKPVAMIADIILDCSRRGDIVLDPFIGAGTTVLAAEKTGRRCFGIELDGLHVDTTIRRWERMTGLQATNDEGQTFAEVSRLELSHE